jgi:hypothetical protein
MVPTKTPFPQPKVSSVYLDYSTGESVKWTPQNYTSTVFSSNHISKMAASQIIFTVESPLIGGLIFLLKVCFMDPTAP